MVERTTIASLLFYLAVALVSAALHEVSGWPASAVFIAIIAFLAAIGIMQEESDE